LKFRAAALATLLPFAALAQTGQPVPSHPINTTSSCSSATPQNCTTWTPAQWVQAWAFKQDVGGSITTSSVTIGGVTLPMSTWIGYLTGTTNPNPVSFDGALSGAGITSLFASPPAIGGASPAAGAFTALSASTLAVIGAITGDLTGATITPTGGSPASMADIAAMATGALPISGGTLIGVLDLAADPVSAMDAATKQYVDSHILAGGMSSSGSTMTGALDLAADPTTSLQAATKHYVDLETTRAEAAEVAAAAVAVNAPFRNRLHNGSFEVQQRGTSFSVTTGTSAYTADRWRVYSSGFTTTAALSSVTGYTSRKGITLSGSVPSGGSVSAFERIEAANSYDLVGQSVTLSFNAKETLSAGTGTFSACLSYPTAADNWAGSTQIACSTFTPTATPTTYTATFAALPTGVANGLSVTLSEAQTVATGTLSWTVTSVQLEAGPAATTFERRPYSVELALCQRYYWAWTGSMLASGLSGNGSSYTIAGTVTFPAAMRAVPTIAPTFGASNGITTSGILSSTQYSTQFYAISNGVTGYSSITLSALTASSDL
jgi:hypothetical protein